LHEAVEFLNELNTSLEVDLERLRNPERYATEAEREKSTALECLERAQAETVALTDKLREVAPEDKERINYHFLASTCTLKQVESAHQNLREFSPPSANAPNARRCWELLIDWRTLTSTCRTVLGTVERCNQQIAEDYAHYQKAKMDVENADELIVEAEGKLPGTSLEAQAIFRHAKTINDDIQARIRQAHENWDELSNESKSVKRKLKEFDAKIAIPKESSTACAGSTAA